MPAEYPRISPPTSPSGHRPTARRPSYVLPTTESHYEVEFDNPSSRVHLGITQNGSRGLLTSASHLHLAYPTVLPSPQREKRRSKDAPSLSRVPEDETPMEASTLRRSEDGRVEPSSSVPTYFGGQSLAGEPEEQEDEERLILDEELARQGIYRGMLRTILPRGDGTDIRAGSYFQILGLYSLTPVFTLLVFVSLAFLPTIAYPLSPDAGRGKSYPYASCFLFPLPEVLTATAFWGLSYLVHSPTFSFFFSVLPRVPLIALTLSSFSLSVVVIALRQAIVPILHIPQAAIFDHPTWRDIAFRRVWWLALGWAAAEAVVGIKQGYEGIALYRDVLVSVRRVLPVPGGNSKFYGTHTVTYGGVGHHSPTRRELSRDLEDSVGSLNTERRPLLERPPSAISSASQSEAQLRDAIEAAVERDVDELVAIRGREELEDLYGMPFIVSTSPSFTPPRLMILILF